MTSTHYVSLDAALYRAVATGGLTGVLLATDEGVQLGDLLVLRERRAGGGRSGAEHTERWVLRRVTHVLTGEGVAPTHALCSFGRAEDTERETALLRRMVGLSERQGVEPERFWRQRERIERARRLRLARAAELVARVRSRANGGDPEASSGGAARVEGEPS